MLTRPFAIPMAQSSSWQRAVREATTALYPLAAGNQSARGPWPRESGYGYTYLPDCPEGEEDDLAIVVTGDPSEADAWARVIETMTPEKFPALPLIDCVDTLDAAGTLNGRLMRFYAIGYDRLEPLTPSVRKFFDDYAHLFLAALGGRRGLPVILHTAPSAAIPRLVEHGAEAGVTEREIHAVVKTLASLQEIGVYVFNITGATVMRHPGSGQPVLTDLGSVTLDAECPVALDHPEIIAAAARQVTFRARHLNMRR